MSDGTSKLVIENNREVPRVVFIEPWGADYTLLPGEQLEVAVDGTTPLPYLHLVELPDSFQIYCENSDSFKVTQNGVDLECGHNRQPPLQA